MSTTRTATLACDWLADYRNSAIVGLQQLVQIPSLAGDEEHAQRALLDLLVLAGVDAALIPLKEANLISLPQYQSRPGGYQTRPNLVATLPGRGGGLGLLLNSHIDVVTPGDEALWRGSPWSGAYREGRVFGRGAADAKGCIWAAALAVMALRATGADLRGDVVLESVVDEEDTGNGTLDLARRGHQVGGAVVLEPTGLQVCYGHRGVLKLRLAVPGLAGHGATREGVNAIVKAAPIIAALDALNDDPRGRLDDRYTPVTVNIGLIAGGIEPYTIAPSCTITCTVRYPPGTAEIVLALLHDAVREAACQDPWLSQHPPEWTTLSKTAASHTDPEGPFVTEVT